MREVRTANRRRVGGRRRQLQSGGAPGQLPGQRLRQAGQRSGLPAATGSDELSALQMVLSAVLMVWALYLTLGLNDHLAQLEQALLNLPSPPAEIADDAAAASVSHALDRQQFHLRSLAERVGLYVATLFGLLLALTISLFHGKRLRRSLQREQQRFNDAITDLSEGFALFDAGDRLLHHNRAFREMLPEAEDRPLTGASYQALSQQIYSQDRDNHAELQARLFRQRESGESIEISDARGRHYAVRERRTRDGGTVCLYLDITQMQRAQRHLRHLASHDVLTGLPNRSHFHTQLNRALQDAAQRQRKVAVLFFDLDNFKHINDSIGHQSGDLLLKAVAHELRRVIGRSDQLARIGGDEFAAMLPALASRVPAAEFAAQLLGRLRQGYLLDEAQICVNASIGVAMYPEDGEDFNVLLDNADAACLRAKAMGKNGFQFYHTEMNLSSARHRRIEHHLKEALEHGELDICYQPQLAVTTEHLAGVEALVRWQHPELGAVSPGEFVPVAEDSGLVIALGEWVLRRALCDFRRLIAFEADPGTLSVNLSRRQFLSPNVVSRVEQLLAESGVPAHRLVLEITETAVLANFDKARVTLQQLHEMGVGIALDDFGAGYSSFDALRHFPLDEIKIDQGFVCDMHHNHRSLAIVRAMIGMARALNATVVAEGIENAEQFALLHQLGCDRGQGFFLGEPMPASAIPGFSNSGVQIGS